ncbi:polysaccharide deacetylase family protein [Streptomyces sp. NPDC004667]|uniref:polysaccharide deacetylase family protein n=1 Tax=Streptomyces sp. NPDC004667 TaxID=3154285 RepID=UPI0033BB6065
MPRSTIRTKRTARSLAVTAALALGVVACGVGAASAAPDPRPTTAPVTAPTAKDAKVPASFAKVSEGGDHTVDLTIDDGPSPVWTPKVLSVLAQNHVKATFCMIGENAVKYPELVKEVAAAGNRLCDHSMDHDMTMDKKSDAYQSDQITAARSAIDAAAGGAKAEYYRAPGGAFTPFSRSVAAAHGLRPLGWDVDPRDWSRPGTANIVAAVEKQLPNGPIILLHDGGGNRAETVAALGQLLPWFKEHGYGFSFPERSAA